MFSNFRRRATTLSVDDELNSSAEGSGFPLAGGGGSGGGSSSLSAVSPRRAAARALAASSLSLPASADNVVVVASSSTPTTASAAAAASTTPTAAALFARVAAPFRSGRRGINPPSRRSSYNSEDGDGGGDGPSSALRRGESGLALLESTERGGGGGRGGGTTTKNAAAVVSPFEVEGGGAAPRRSPRRPPSSSLPSSSSSSSSASLADPRAYEASVMRKVDRAILPCFMALTLVNYLDRTNLAYASTQMSADVGLTPAQYGVGSSIFFLSYVGMQLPLVAVGCRVGRVPFLAASCVAWGVSAAAFAGVRGVPSFYFLRLLLGASEAATFPIMWAHIRAFYAHDDAALGHAYSFVTAVIAAAQIVGGPLAALLLRLDGVLFGLRGWQVLFLFEAAPTLGVAAWVLRLPRSPEEARGFLDADERRWLSAKIRNATATAAAAVAHKDSGSDSSSSAAAVERPGSGTGKNNTFSPPPPSPSSSPPSPSSFSAVFAAARSALSSPWIWVLGAIEALVAAAKYGVIYWTPLLVAAMVTGGGGGGFASEEGRSGGGEGAASAMHQHHAPPPPASAAAAVAALSAVPFGLAAVATMANAAHSKRTGERRWHVVWPVACCAAGLAALGVALGRETTTTTTTLSSSSSSSSTASSAAAAAAPAFASLVVASLVFAAAGVVSSYPSSIIKRSMASARAEAAAAAAAATLSSSSSAAAAAAAAAANVDDDAAAALGYGLANALGNVGGLVGPAAFGAARARTGGYSSACAMLSAFAAVAAVLYAVVLPRVSPDGEVVIVGGGGGGGGRRSGRGGGGGGARAAAAETPTSK